MLKSDTRHRASTSTYSANILRSRYVARTPPLEARSPDRRSNVENGPPHLPSTASHRPASHAHFPYTARNFENAPVTCRHRPAARAHPAKRLHYVIILRDGRKLVTRVCVMLPQQCNPCTDYRGQLLPLPQLTSGSVQ